MGKKLMNETLSDIFDKGAEKLDEYEIGSKEYSLGLSDLIKIFNAVDVQQLKIDSDATIKANERELEKYKFDEEKALKECELSLRKDECASNMRSKLEEAELKEQSLEIEKKRAKNRWLEIAIPAATTVGIGGLMMWFESRGGIFNGIGKSFLSKPKF